MGDRQRPAHDLGGPAEEDLTAAVVVVSTSAAARGAVDATGPLLVAALREWGFAVGEPVVVPDGAGTGPGTLAAVLRSEVAARTALVLTTGGTGLRRDDVTPEVTRGLRGREVPGIAEALRTRGVAAGVPTAVLSRGVAVVVARTLVVNIAGSVGAVRDAVEVLAPVLPHAVAQVRADPPRTLEA